VPLLENALAFLLVALVSGNNLPVCCGALISSRMVSRKAGIAIAVLGYSAGFAAQRNFLAYGMHQIIPSSAPGLLAVPLGISAVLFILAHRLRVPQSLSLIFTSAVVGMGIAIGGAPDMGFALEIAAFWIAGMAAAFAMAFFALGALRKALYRRRIWKSLEAIRLLLIAFSFLAAFTLGANTIGMVYASVPEGAYSPLAIIAAIAVGSLALSRGELKRIGEEIMPLRYANALVSQAVSVIIVEAATLLSIPISNTQTFTAGLYGSGASYKARLLLKKPAFTMASVWLFTVAAGLASSYALTLLLMR
jgi:PiT family inorganic phosphate transporter